MIMLTPSPHKKKTINLALQGGGAHGAYAWGVLDKLLEDGRIDIEGISATSAGTMNACALAYGMHLGGQERAREELTALWRNIHEVGSMYNPVRNMPWDKPLAGNGDYSLGYQFFDAWTHLFSPYQTNPFDFNPLRTVMEKSIDFEALRHCDCVKLFISTTQVSTGKVHVFEAKDVTLDVVMASACLPFLYKAVDIDGEPYWDGGYMGNPALFPLFYQSTCRDILIVHINPIERRTLPTTAQDIVNRVNEISFNSPLLHELRAIAFVKKLIRGGMLKKKFQSDFKDILVHAIRADGVMCDLTVASKFNSDWDFLTGLRDRGRETMSSWLNAHYDDVNNRDTVDIMADYIDPTTNSQKEGCS